MKIAAASMIKDECDIIELFIRINSSWADHFFILDNGSSDHTPHILRRLAEVGYAITVTHDPAIHYRQAEMTTRLVQGIAARQEFDFIFPIDGDEFIADPEAFRASLSALGPSQVGSVEWSTLVPNDGAVMTRSAPLFDGFARRRTEVRGVRKVVIPNDLAQKAAIQMGNHIVHDASGAPVTEVPLPVPLFHVPVRSKEQIIAKTLIGSYKMAIKEGRKRDEVFHWDLIARFIRSNNFVLSDEQLRDIALGYGWSQGDPKVRDTIPQPIGSADVIQQYAELARPNLPLLIDGFLNQLCEEIRLTRSTVSLTKKLLRKALRW